MGRVYVGRRLSSPVQKFADREDAGRRLAALLSGEVPDKALVYGLPRGGLATGAPIADVLGSPLLPLVVRKLPIPASPEMGFGAVAIDGTRVLNQGAMTGFGISSEEADRVTEDVLTEVRRRAAVYSGSDAPPEVSGRHVVLVDDGLATGFTMLVAARLMHGREPASLTLAVPCSPVETLNLLRDGFDSVFCLFAQKEGPFAVASFYRDFHEMSDAEVKECLQGRLSRSRPSEDAIARQIAVDEA